MKKQTEIKWIGCILVSMILLVAVMTDFTFHDLEFQLHDTYFVVRAYYCIVYGTAIIYTIKNLFLLIDLVAERYKVIALLISIVNPLVALFLVVILYMGVHSLAELRSNYSEIPMTGKFIPVVFLLALLIAQVVVQVRMLKKLRGMIAG